MKTKEELDALKEEAENLNKKFTALSDEELEQVAGGGSGLIGENFVREVIINLKNYYKNNNLSPEAFKREAEAFLEAAHLDPDQERRLRHRIEAYYNGMKN